MSQPKYQGIRRTVSREALLDAAEILMGTQDFSGVSIDEIVDRAGVAKGTFYNHFVDKSDIGNQLAIRIRSEVRDRITQAKSDDAAVHLATAMSIFMELAVSQPHRAGILITLLDGVTDTDHSMNVPVRTNLERGKQSKRLVYGRLDSALALIFGAISAGITYIMREGGPETSAYFAQNLVQHTLIGMGVDQQEAETIAGTTIKIHFTKEN